MTTKKPPAFMFYVRDWLTDEHLAKVSFQTKGIWIDLLAYFWLSETRGKTTATRRELCKMLGCTAHEFRRFLDENERHPFCDVSFENGVYTIENRRMLREEAERATTRGRVQRFRNGSRNAPCNADVTPPLAVAVAVAVTERDKDIPLYPPSGYTERHLDIIRKAWFATHGYEPSPDRLTEADWEQARRAEPRMTDIEAVIAEHRRRHAYKSVENLLRGVAEDWYAPGQGGDTPQTRADMERLAQRIAEGA